jgi:hypothetical protein
MSEPASTNESDGKTRLEYILGVPLAENVVRQWPQMKEQVKGSSLIGKVEGNFKELTLAVGRRHSCGNVLVVEWSNNYGDGEVYRNVTIAELQDGKAIRVTDYWGKPFTTPGWRQELTETLNMPSDGIWPSVDNLTHH